MNLISKFDEKSYEMAELIMNRGSFDSEIKDLSNNNLLHILANVKFNE